MKKKPFPPFAPLEMDTTAPPCNGALCGGTQCDQCKRGVCDECSATCDECRTVHCYECVDSCDECARFVCQECIDVTTYSCTCCKIPMDDPLGLCAVCAMSVRTNGIKCSTCTHHGCREGECKIKKVSDAQVTCPICLEDIVADRSIFQPCGMHRVCNGCAPTLPPWLGCPLCRAGHFTL